MKEHNYKKELLKFAANEIKPGTLTIVSVLHDDWCDFLTGGTCNCDPEIVREYQSDAERTV